MPSCAPRCTGTVLRKVEKNCRFEESCLPGSAGVSGGSRGRQVWVSGHLGTWFFDGLPGRVDPGLSADGPGLRPVVFFVSFLVVTK